MPFAAKNALRSFTQQTLIPKSSCRKFGHLARYCFFFLVSSSSCSFLRSSAANLVAIVSSNRLTHRRLSPLLLFSFICSSSSIYSFAPAVPFPFPLPPLPDEKRCTSLQSFKEIAVFLPVREAVTRDG